MNRSFDPLFQAASDRYGVPFDWIKAIAITESSLNPKAYRAEPQINDASRGLMQVLMRTAVGLGYKGTPDGLYDPATSIDLGTKLIAENMQRFGPDFAAVYSAYNWDPRLPIRQTPRSAATSPGRLTISPPLTMTSWRSYRCQPTMPPQVRSQTTPELPTSLRPAPLSK